MAPYRAKQASIQDAVVDCKAAVLALTGTAEQAILYHDECLKLAKFVKRLSPLLDDLQDNKPNSAAEQDGAQALQVHQLCFSIASFFCMQTASSGTINLRFDVHKRYSGSECC